MTVVTEAVLVGSTSGCCAPAVAGDGARPPPARRYRRRRHALRGLPLLLAVGAGALTYGALLLALGLVGPAEAALRAHPAPVVAPVPRSQ